MVYFMEVEVRSEQYRLFTVYCTYVLDSTISKKITTRQWVKHRSMAATISNHGRDSHLASQSIHFIWKSRLNENSRPPPLLRFNWPNTSYCRIGYVTQIDRIGTVPNCDQTLRSICLISNLSRWFWQRHHSNETRFLEDVSFKQKGYKKSQEGVQWLLSTPNIPVPTQSKLWAAWFYGRIMACPKE